MRRRVRSPVPSFHHFLRVPSGSFPPLFQDTGSVLLLPRSAVTEAETSAKGAKGVGRWELRGLERNRLPTDALSSPLTGKKSENVRGCGDPPSTTVANKKAGFRQSRSLDFWHSELKNRRAAPASRWRIKKKRKKKIKKGRKRNERVEVEKRVGQASSRDSLLFLCRFPARIRHDNLLIESGLDPIWLVALTRNWYRVGH